MAAATDEGKFADLDDMKQEDDDATGFDFSESDDEQEQKMASKLESIQKKKEAAEEQTVTLSRNAQIEAKHSKDMIAFAPPFLIGPFVPFLMSLCTIFFGSVIMNIHPMAECTEPLPCQIFLSYIYVIGYGAVFVGLGPIKWTNMFTFKLAVYAFGAIAVIWNIVGTAIFSSSDACKVTTPQLYSLAEWQVLMFWITFAVYAVTLGRSMYIARFANQRSRRAAQADRIRKLEEEDRKLKARAMEEEEAKRAEEAEQEAEEEKRRLEKEAEDAKKRALAEQYGVSDSEESDDEIGGVAVPGSTS